MAAGSERRLGFTLIELLVIVAIVALLVAIIVPSLGKARSKSREVACSSNLRQVGQICMAYASEWDGHLPFEPTEHNPHPKLVELAARINIPPRVFYCNESTRMEEFAQATIYTPVGGKDSVIDTPENNAAGNISYIFWSFEARKKFGALYWRNPAFVPRRLRTHEALAVIGAPAPADVSPSDRWMVADFFRQGAPFPHTRNHAQGVNVMYLDGHADLVLGSPQQAYR